jgi:hypothetical protein
VGPGGLALAVADGPGAGDALALAEVPCCSGRSVRRWCPMPAEFTVAPFSGSSA